ncbi:AraC-like DNA-binding protein [Rhodoferax ferrireducens]|uniref:AraC-like DNA-binding protein n=1 Tax=Rhodoferax ferrireducens TaxID=192843 RepID=A0ABU2C5W8_9BURK|nr:AraC family transcriptional regulator [Rhodoferax ferrireducens]MDR7376732.1 AraC-like DNA-binding protein [Rhodoferax ferrireducens]
MSALPQPQTQTQHYPDPQAIGAACQIHARVAHRVATLTLHADLLVWVQSGSKTVHHARGSYRCNAGQLLMLAKDSVWDVVNDPAPQSRYLACVLQIDPEMAADFHQRYPALAGNARPVLAQVLAVDGPLGPSLQAAADALTGSSPLSPTLQRHRVTEVLLMLAERGWVFPPNHQLSSADRVRRVVAGRLHADWTAEAVAQALHTSPSTLARQLAKEGSSIAATVREARLEAALGMLQTSELPVGEIAQHCGYASHSRFGAAFKSRFGFVPSLLRETA